MPALRWAYGKTDVGEGRGAFSGTTRGTHADGTIGATDNQWVHGSRPQDDASKVGQALCSETAFARKAACRDLGGHGGGVEPANGCTNARIPTEVKSIL